MTEALFKLAINLDTVRIWQIRLSVSLLSLLTALFALSVNAQDDGDDDDGGDGGDPDIEEEALVTIDLDADPEPGYPMFLSPHVKPIVVNGLYVYVTNTQSDTIDVISRLTHEVETRINVGVDPVALAVRPDGMEIWVANHISDTVNVVDTNPASPSFHQVVGTVQELNLDTQQSLFDEPVGIAFANNEKAYVALSTQNQIAVVDVVSRTVIDRLRIKAQDPRAITVRDGKLYVIPFESNNQTQLSGCFADDIDGDVCTFDAIEHVFSNNNVLSLNYDADIVVNPDLPDRDIFIFDTEADRMIEIVRGVGTLLYDLTVDSQGNVFVAQTDARNAVNGRAGTLKHGLAEMENRAFLNQITSIYCPDRDCEDPERIELEPLPPEHPLPEDALATPYGIQISDDDEILFFTAAGSNKFVSMDPATGEILDRVSVGAVPRGIALESSAEGSALKAWTYDVAGNTVSLIDVSEPDAMSVINQIELFDPTHPDVKLGRIAFNNALMSSTGTFSCESCHPDGHTDQLIWVLQTPACAGEGNTFETGCTQIPPRLTMPVRGARDTEPYHWDGIPGDPYGGNNTANITSNVEPNCDIDDPLGCIRVLIDGSLATTMCEETTCPEGEDGSIGFLSHEEREAMGKFILTVPYPPGPGRTFSNELTSSAVEGFKEFNLEKDCGTCHRFPFLVSTNTPGTGMDAPTWRGAYDRWMVTPQARLNIIDLMNLVNIPNNFPEDRVWILAGATPQIFDMVLEQNNGFSGSYSRQLTIDQSNHDLEGYRELLEVLEESADEGGILLQGTAIVSHGIAQGFTRTTIENLSYRDGEYVVEMLEPDDSELAEAGFSYTTDQLFDYAANGTLSVTLTGRTPQHVNYDFPQPGIWPVGEIQQQSGVINFAHLSEDLTLRMKGRHIHPGASVYIDGRKVYGVVECEVGGELPRCDEELILIHLTEGTEFGGMHFVQVQNYLGKFSNDAIIWNGIDQIPYSDGNLIRGGGDFESPLADRGDSNWNNWRKNEFGGAGTIRFRNGRVEVNVADVNEDTPPWFLELAHGVTLVEDREYTLCYSVRADGSRSFRTRIDKGADRYQSFLHEDFDVGIPWVHMRHTITPDHTDISSRIVFNMAQAEENVYIDNIGLYEGSACGNPVVSVFEED